MRADDAMQIDYQMNKRELAEMCIRAQTEAFVRQKVILTVILVLAAYGLLGTFFQLILTRRFVITWLGWFVILFVAAYFLVMFVANYRHYIHSGLLKPQRIRLEQGYLYTGLEGNGRFPCRNYTEIKNGRLVLMIGVRNAKNITSYIGIPKRAFTGPGEVDAFLWLLENSCPSEENIDRRPILDRGGDMVFTFNVTEEMWAHIYGEAVQVLTDKSLLGRKRIPTGLVAGILLVIFAVRWVLSGFSLLDRDLLYFVVFLAVEGFLLLSDTLRSRKSDAYYRSMAATGKIQNDTIGIWEIGIRPEGGYVYDNDKYQAFLWSDYCHRFDMGDTLFFFDKHGKRYLFIPKEVFKSQEEADRFYGYFYQMGIQFQPPVVKSGWNPKMVLGIVLLALAAAGLGGAMVTSVVGNVYRSIEENGPAIYQDPMEETEPFVFHKEDYPDYMPLEVQVEVLKSLGIEPPSEEKMEQYKTWMEEDDYYRAYIEGTPYVGILGEMGVGDYDEEKEEYIYHPSVYWLDFESWDISENYIDILKGFHAMSGGDFELTEMKEDLQNANWDEGTGAILVLFRYNKNAYAFEARMMYDWIDPDIIGFFNEVLEQEKNPKRIFYMDDGGQGGILFYNTRSWANDFYGRTGIKLEALSRSGPEPWIPTVIPGT